MEDRLKAILANTNDWLKFAETKNGALFAANVATVFGLLRLLAETSSFHPIIHIYMAVAVICLVCSAVLCLVSFIPTLRPPKQSKIRKLGSGDNLLFYMHIADYTDVDYLKALYAQSGKGQELPCTIEQAYAKQIVVNARIARLKYEIFSLAIWFTLSALVTPLGSTILYFVKKRS